MRINERQLAQVNDRINALVTAGSFYGKKLKEAGITHVADAEEFEKLPFSEKADLRDAYPLGLMTAPEEEIVRIHSSSGTTGLPVIIPYTAKDVDDWGEMFRRCYETAGIGKGDRIQITPGYGLWTAGIGFQNGCEKLGAMAVPMGPGNTEKQLQMMMDLKTTVLCSTSSYALLLAEEIERRGIRDKIHLKKGVIGSERWSKAMRERIQGILGIELYDIYGLTEIYGPGIGKGDRIQITPGYGLWTAGIGFQNGCEKLGAMAVPMGPGNTEKQLQMMMDLKTTVLCSTSSYALLLAEEIERRGIRDKIHLKKGVIGSERWSKAMRERIQGILGIELYDIYGLTEIYGPGIGINCKGSDYMHIWDDYLYLEIIDPVTGKNLPDGEWGEIVITTLVKEGAPLIRYRTHDLSRIIPGKCECGRSYPRIDIIKGRTDDMIKIKGVNVFPAQIEEVLAKFEEASSSGHVDFAELSKKIAAKTKAAIGFTPIVKVVEAGLLPRSEKKSKRVFDERYD